MESYLKNLLPLHVEIIKELKKQAKRIPLPQSLFEPDWSALKDRRCPFCLNRLKYSELKSIYFCRSKKHLKSFVIKKRRYDEVVDNSN